MPRYARARRLLDRGKRQKFKARYAIVGRDFVKVQRMVDDERLMELEVRLAYQEDMLNALNQVVSRQAEQIDRLEGMNRELYARFRQLVDGQSIGKIEDEPPPPHY